MNPGEFPHSEISGSMLICSSPKLIAAYHVFHRLPVPRHSPCALVRLTIQTILSREWLVFPLDSFLPTKIIVTLPFEIVIFLKKELTIIFVSQLLFSFQGTSLSVLFRALKIEQYLLNLYLSPVPEANHLLMFSFCLTPQKGGDPAAGSPTATLLRLHPNHQFYLRRRPPCG